MKRSLLLSVFVAAIAALPFTQAHAQSCEDDAKLSFQACIDDGIEACAESATACNPLSAALTISDVRDIARARCCSFNKARRRKACIATEKNRYTPVASRGTQRAFFIAARKSLEDLRRTDCAADPEPPYSSLF